MKRTEKVRPTNIRWMRLPRHWRESTALHFISRLLCWVSLPLPPPKDAAFNFSPFYLFCFCSFSSLCPATMHCIFHPFQDRQRLSSHFYRRIPWWRTCRPLASEAENQYIWPWYFILAAFCQVIQTSLLFSFFLNLSNICSFLLFFPLSKKQEMEKRKFPYFFYG